MPVTKKEIAEHLGLSRTSVSLVLNNSPSSTISEETKKKILETAKEMGFPISEQSRKICYILYNREAEDPRYMYDLKSIENAASRFDYTLIFKNVKSSPEDYLKLVKFLQVRGTDGFIVTGDIDDVIVDIMEKAQVPYLFYGGTIRDKTNVVTFDHKKVAYTATKHLIASKHRRIALFIGPLEYPIHRHNLEGYKIALQDAGIDFDQSLVQVSREEDGYELCYRMELLGIDYTAIYCTNTVIQFTALHYFKERGVHVPLEKSLIGNGYSELVEVSKPRLTTVLGDPAQIETVVFRLIDIIRKKVKEPEVVYLNKVKLIEGETVSILFD